MIEAKPVVPDQFWILRQDDRKIGNIEAESGGYAVNLNGHTLRVQTLSMLSERLDIDFQDPYTVHQPIQHDHMVHGYPTSAKPHNAIFNVQYQLPLWTEEPNSRSWLAAGWYRLQQHRTWRVVFCPKLILLTRYPFEGPYHTQDQARST